MDNWLLCTDVYKLGHMEQYPHGTTKVYSYLTTRSARKYDEVVFFGLQYILRRYLSQPITTEMIEELLLEKRAILGSEGDTRRKLMALKSLGYLPIKIKAVDEGAVLPAKNVLMTITNTHPDFHWLPGYLESMLLHLWNSCTVATASRRYYKLVRKYAEQTCLDFDHLPFAVHDFGYRGVSSNETAAISGAAHLLHFKGTDTVQAVHMLRKYYFAEEPIGLSVPASEHSVMCAYGIDNEMGAFVGILDTYPKGIVSIVSDTYDIWHVMTKVASALKDWIIARDGKVVFRPDSGDPMKIICGDPEGATEEERKGCLQLLWDVFGGSVNSKGYRVLNPKVGLIYGDGMYYERFEKILEQMKQQGWASSNLVIGVGGLLLQQHNRDDLGFSIKATYVEVNGQPRNIKKDPVTDREKKSHCGMIQLTKQNGSWETIDQCSAGEESGGWLETVFKNGVLVKPQSLNDIRARARLNNEQDVNI